MQCNQPYFFTGPPQSQNTYTPQCKQYTPPPQMCNQPCNDVVGEGEITTVLMPDGSVQHFFLPVKKWPQYPQNTNCWNSAPGLWLIRGFPNVYQQPNSIFGFQGLACNSNMALPPAGFQVKFHQDGITSTTDLLYFCPQLRSDQRLQCSGVQVHVPEVCSKQCQPDGGNVTHHGNTRDTSFTQTNKSKCECNKEHSKRKRRKESRMSVDDDGRNRKKGRIYCESNTSNEDMSIDVNNKGSATSSGTVSSGSLCATCLDDRKKIKAIKSLEKEQKERERKVKKGEKKWLKKQKEKEEAKRKQQEKSMNYDSDVSNYTCSTSFKLGDALSSTQYSMCTDVEMASNDDCSSVNRERELYHHEQDFIRTLEMDQKRLEEEKKRLEQEKRELEIEKRKLKKEQIMARASMSQCHSNMCGYQKDNKNSSSHCCSSSKNDDIFSSARNTFCNDIEMRSDYNGDENKSEIEIMNEEKKLLKALESEQKRLQKERRRLEKEKTKLGIKMSKRDGELHCESKPLLINKSYTKVNPSQKAVNNTDEKQCSEKANNSNSNEWEKSVQRDVSKTSCSCMTVDSSFSKIGGDFSSSENIPESDKTSNSNAADKTLQKELIKREKRFLKMLEIEQKRLAQEKLLLEKKKSKQEKSENEKLTICDCKSGTNSTPKADSCVSAMSVEKVDGSTTDEYSLLAAASGTQNLNCMCGPPPPTCDRLVETSPKETTNATEESDHFRFNVFPFTTNLASYRSRLQKISRDLYTQSNSERIEFD